MEDNRFEKNVAEEMGSFKLKPSDAVWQQVDAQLKEDRKRRRWVIFFLFTTLLLGGAGLFYITADNNAPALTATHKTTTDKANTNNGSEQAANTNTIPVTVNEQQQHSNTAGKTIIEAKTPVLTAAATKGSANKQQQSVLTVSANSKSKPVKETKQLTDLPVIKDKQQPKPVTKNEEAVVAATEKNNTAITADTAAVIDTKTETITEPVTTKDSTVQITADSISTTASIIAVNSSAAPKSKWRVGLHVNAGIAQIRESVFPGVMSSTADASPLLGNNGGTGGPTSITVNQFTVKPGMQLGIGFVLRKTILKKHAFVTGLQYQYSSYKVEQTQRIDSFYQVTNSFSTVRTTGTVALFATHSIALPLDVEWKIAATSNGMFRLGTGLQQWFTLSSVKNGTVTSSFRYSGTTSTSGGAATAQKTTWQPVLQLAPLYEWNTKKQTSQLGLYFNYGLRPVYKTTASDYWWQTGLRYRFYFHK